MLYNMIRQDELLNIMVIYKLDRPTNKIRIICFGISIG
jgi:hypothetical protein